MDSNRKRTSKPAALMRPSARVRARKKNWKLKLSKYRRRQLISIAFASSLFLAGQPNIKLVYFEFIKFICLLSSFRNSVLLPCEASASGTSQTSYKDILKMNHDEWNPNQIVYRKVMLPVSLSTSLSTHWPIGRGIRRTCNELKIELPQ